MAVKKLILRKSILSGRYYTFVKKAQAGLPVNAEK
jgi:hypothetical protein